MANDFCTTRVVTEGYLEERLKPIEEFLTTVKLTQAGHVIVAKKDWLLSEREIDEQHEEGTGACILTKVREEQTPIPPATTPWAKVQDLDPSHIPQWWILDWDGKDPSRLTTWEGSASQLREMGPKFCPTRVARINHGS